MLDFFLIIDNTFKPTISKDVELEIKKYEKLSMETNNKITKLKTSFVEGVIAPNDFQKELKSLERDLESINNKLLKLNELKQNNDYKQDAKMFFNIKEIEKLKLKSEYVKRIIYGIN